MQAFELMQPTPGETVFISEEFSILKRGGKLVSLRGLPNREFAARTGMSAFKRMLFGFAGKKYDKMTTAGPIRRNNKGE